MAVYHVKYRGVWAECDYYDAFDEEKPRIPYQNG